MWPSTDEMGYTLIGSHLDSVIDGGRYDGVAGVIAGLMVDEVGEGGRSPDPAAGRCIPL